MRKVDKAYVELIKLGYENLLLETLTDKDLIELWESEEIK